MQDSQDAQEEESPVLNKLLFSCPSCKSEQDVQDSQDAQEEESNVAVQEVSYPVNPIILLLLKGLRRGWICYPNLSERLANDKKGK